MSSTSSAKRTNPIHDSSSEKWSYLYVNISTTSPACTSIVGPSSTLMSSLPLMMKW